MEEESRTLPGEKEMLEEIPRALAAFEKRRDQVIPILQMIQEHYSYLSKTAMKLVAEHVGISTSEVYGIATFYNQFRFRPPGRHRIQVCLGTACHVVGGDIILENFERKLGIKEGETTPDGEFDIERVACVGCCALAPVAIVDGDIFGQMAPSRVEGLFVGFELDREREKREGRRADAVGSQDNQ